MQGPSSRRRGGAGGTGWDIFLPSGPCPTRQPWAGLAPLQLWRDQAGYLPAFRLHPSRYSSVHTRPLHDGLLTWDRTWAAAQRCEGC